MIEHRKELRDKVETQQKLLQKALKTSETAGGLADRVTALKTELSVVADSLTGGWDKMTDTTAARLSEWLETTRNLVQGKEVGVTKANPPPPISEMVKEVGAGDKSIR